MMRMRSDWPWNVVSYYTRVVRKMMQLELMGGGEALLPAVQLLVEAARVQRTNASLRL